ncbi:hypothetical protein HCH_07088 [Hahella chejuensis KCTC 2396]|uniref:Uncharacterized protein n=1 Tax=Hahella chejuensis (strain KCTC 2396) TaxID=349521 RepID=Q2S6M3_HAHCH|nr:hypothetical protein HCH_07088 [Hahella chejuensis KCTC 2396]
MGVAEIFSGGRRSLIYRILWINVGNFSWLLSTCEFVWKR